jgi:hypothetical protein
MGERTTRELLERIEKALHLHFEAEAAEFVEQVRGRWNNLVKEKRYWQRRCGKYERGLDAFAERYSDEKMPPPKKGRGTA